MTPRMVWALRIGLGMVLFGYAVAHYSQQRTLPSLLWVILGVGAFTALGRLSLPDKLKWMVPLALGVTFFGLTLAYVRARFTP